MSWLADLLARLLRTESPPPLPGEPAALDAASAVALTEDCIAAVSGAAPGTRPTLGAAMGRSMGGMRAAAWLAGDDLAGAVDLASVAAGRHLPLVVHVRCRATARHGASRGVGHEGWHALADTGCVQLFARNVQEAVDLALIARRVAERTLLPVLVAHDGDLGVQDVRLPPAALVQQMLGDPEDQIVSPGPAQHALFGPSRRRVPRWYDLDHPALHGAAVGTEAWGVGAAAQRPWFGEPVAAALAEAMDRFAELTGRRPGPLWSEGVEGAATVLVGQGRVVEVARAVAAAIGQPRVGVIGIGALRPFPSAELARLLEGAARIVVLDRADSPLGDPPLLREVRGAMGGRDGLTGALVGLGGLPLRASDLSALCHALDLPPLVYLGVAFDDRSARYPKRSAALDALRRARPDVGSRGIRAGTLLDARPPGSLTIHAPGLVDAAGRWLHRLLGGHLRAAGPVLTHSRAPLADPGDELRPDLRIEPAAGVIRAGDRTFLVPDPTPDRLLGALAGVLARLGHVEDTPRKLLAARRPDADEQALAAFEAGLSEVVEGEAPRSEPDDEAPPLAVRRLGRTDGAWDSLPRFWDQVGVLYRDGAMDAAVADPWMAVAALPPLSASFRRASSEAVPALDPGACTGCGACWVACPHGALLPAAFPVRTLLETGIAAAAAHGQRADALRPLISTLSSKVQGRAGRAGPLLEEGFAALAGKLPAARRQPSEEALQAVARQVSELPVIAAEPYAEEVLTLALDPDACRGCGACVAACEADALALRDRNAERVATARREREIWALLPDTSGQTIARLRKHEQVGPAAAVLLSRHTLLAMAGAGEEAPGSGARLALRLFLASAEWSLQSRLEAWREEVRALAGRLREALRAEVADGLPLDDLRAAEEALAAGGIGAGTPRQRRLLHALKSVSDLAWRLAEGPGHLGRARLGLLISDPAVAAWAAPFPYNGFQAPVVVGAPELAPGLLEAQLDAAIADLDRVRCARAALDDKADPDPLTWSDLSDAERAVCPPLVVVTARPEEVPLPGDLPLKVLVLTAAPPGDDLPQGPYVLQSSPAAADHLMEGGAAVFAWPGPALVRLHAPLDLAAAREALPSVALVHRRAGTDPTEAIRAEIQAGLQADHEVELASLRASYEEKMRALRAEIEQEMSERVRRRLLTIAGYEAGR